MPRLCNVFNVCAAVDVCSLALFFVPARFGAYAYNALAVWYLKKLNMQFLDIRNRKKNTAKVHGNEQVVQG